MSAHTRAPHGMDWRRRASGRDSAGSTEPCAAFMAILKDGRGSCRPAGRPAGCRRGDGRQSPPVAGRRTALPLRWLPAASGRGAAGRSPGGRTPPPPAGTCQRRRSRAWRDGVLEDGVPTAEGAEGREFAPGVRTTAAAAAAAAGEDSRQHRAIENLLQARGGCTIRILQAAPRVDATNKAGSLRPSQWARPMSSTWIT